MILVDQRDVYLNLETWNFVFVQNLNISELEQQSSGLHSLQKILCTGFTFSNILDMTVIFPALQLR